MLITVILFLREVLEAALILSVLLAVSFHMNHSRKWIYPALFFGFFGASISAYYLGDISNLLDGTGQEVMNACQLILMTLLINLICVCLAQFFFWDKEGDFSSFARVMKLILITSVGIAVMHEGSELAIYSYSFIQTHDNKLSLLLGGGLGLGIGASLGAIIYYFLVNLQRKNLIKVAIGILILVAAGMTSQAVFYLIQSGWLPSHLPLWDTSSIISERSITGQILYALVGYEATPSPLQVMFYFAVIFFCLISIFISLKLKDKLLARML